MRPLAVAAVAAAGVACSGQPKVRALPDAGPDAIVIHSDQLVIRRGPIGREDNVPGTYVLVDVENKTPEDRMVAADGQLKDVTGRAIAPLAVDEVRVPAGERRTLALVSIENLPGAVGAGVRLKGAAPLFYPAPLTTEDASTADVDGAFVAKAKIRNTQKGQGEANILCSFYDKDGHLLARQFQRLVIPAGDAPPVTFTGPPGSTRAVIYPGESLF